MTAEMTVDLSSLVTNDPILVKSNDADEWDNIVYIVTKNGSKLKEGWS